MLYCSTVHIGPRFHWDTDDNTQWPGSHCLSDFTQSPSPAPSVPDTNTSLNVPGRYGSALETALAVYTSWNFFSTDIHMANSFDPLERLCSNHTLTIAILFKIATYPDLCPGTPEPLYTSQPFLFPQNLSLSNMLHNLLIYYVYCLTPISSFKT